MRYKFLVQDNFMAEQLSMVLNLTIKLGGPFGDRDAICQVTVAFDNATSKGSSILIAHLKWGSGLAQW